MELIVLWTETCDQNQADADTQENVTLFSRLAQQWANFGRNPKESNAQNHS
jgi:hypothetical protein